jgi:5-methylcytosine-specific restriction protein A
VPLLYYWRGDNYRRDLDMGAGYHLNQANPLMHHIDTGDSLWAFTRTRDGRYALAAELVVRAKTLNPPNYRYGRYRVWGDLTRSRYFKVDGQPRMEQVIRALSCRAEADALGRSFQGAAAVRRITAEDHRILCQAAQDLPLEPRARILPEERLEAAILVGDTGAVDALVRQERPGIAEERVSYLYRQAPTRSRQLVNALQEMYSGRCQVCLWDPRQVYAEELCQGHHLQWLSRGGEDELENMLLLCPNHHAAVHQCDAPFDFGDYAFDFCDHREPLRANLHLGRCP